MYLQQSVSTLVRRYPQERNMIYLEDKLAYQKKTNVTTEEEGTHTIIPRGLSDTPGNDPTMTALSQLQLGLVEQDRMRSYTRFWLSTTIGA